MSVLQGALPIPYFRESKHPLIQSLSHHSDRQLLTLWQRYPERGRYFVAIFCRYGELIYATIAHQAALPTQLDYLFALTWREIFAKIDELKLDTEIQAKPELLKTWLLDLTNKCLQQEDFSSSQSNDYDLSMVSPPLWCYLQQALGQLPPLVRFILIMAEKFQWSPTRIVAYLQSEGDLVSLMEVENYLNQGYQILQQSLPEDIREIYGKADRKEN